jgi:hypothetical protein
LSGIVFLGLITLLNLFRITRPRNHLPHPRERRIQGRFLENAGVQGNPLRLELLQTAASGAFCNCSDER